MEPKLSMGMFVVSDDVLMQLPMLFMHATTGMVIVAAMRNEESATTEYLAWGPMFEPMSEEDGPGHYECDINRETLDVNWVRVG